MEIPIYYDPMLAKLVVYGATRAAAINKMLAAIAHYEIEGIETTLPFGKFVFQHEAFKNGQFDTSFVGRYFTPAILMESKKEEALVAAALAGKLLSISKKQLKTVNETGDEWWTKRG